jgi:hypothetical protein
MAILAEGGGTHFDPQVLRCFEGMAPAVRGRLQGLDESAIQKLMADMIERHFDAMTT